MGGVGGVGEVGEVEERWGGRGSRGRRGVGKENLINKSRGLMDALLVCYASQKREYRGR